MLYRTSSGAIAALEDACPHRLTPLSMGRLRGDTVECGYHGMTFDCAGRCVRIPGQQTIPAARKGAVLSGGREHGSRLDLDGRSGAGRSVNRLRPAAISRPELERRRRRRAADRLSLSQSRRQSVRSGACQLRASLDARQRLRRGRAGPYREARREASWSRGAGSSIRRQSRCSRNSATSPAMSIAGTTITTRRRASP